MKTKICVIFLVLTVYSNVAVALDDCYHQICMECSEKEAAESGQKARCDLSNIASTRWLKDDLSPVPPLPNVPVDYACIKMYSSNPDIHGDSTDSIRGCVPKGDADSVCSLLVGVQQAKGKKNAKCVSCTSDLCNGSLGLQVPAVLLIGSAFLAFLRSAY